MKNLSPRQQKIVSLLEQKGHVGIDEIRDMLGVSQATAYREIQALTESGIAAKVPGGISQVEKREKNCVQCGREVNPRSAFIIEQTDGSRVSACCPHCGLMALSNRRNASMAMVTDFFYGTILSANQAWYVMNSDVSLCCRPSLLTFSNVEDARRFCSSFGGEVLDFIQAKNSLRTIMTL